MTTYKEIMELAVKKGELQAEFPDERAAYDFRARCYAWRQRQQKQGITHFDTVVIRKARGAKVLRFETGSREIVITDANGERLFNQSTADDKLLKDALELGREIWGEETISKGDIE